MPGLLRDKTPLPPLSADKKLAIIEKTATEKPAMPRIGAFARWPKAQGVSPAVSSAFGREPASSRISSTFKLSNDPKFVEKLYDVVGLYLNPPEDAIVLCVDEKSQIQALDRTQPGLPMKKGRCGTMTHDYKRNGTTTLFAALNMLMAR